MACPTKKIPSSRKLGKTWHSPNRQGLATRKFRPVVEALEERTLLSGNVQVTFYADPFFKQGIYDVSFTLLVLRQTVKLG